VRQLDLDHDPGPVAFLIERLGLELDLRNDAGLRSAALAVIVAVLATSVRPNENQLDLPRFLPYKFYMRITREVKTALKREYTLYSNAISFYKKVIRERERKHHLSTQTFLKRFETGQLGDDADYFDWYAFAKLLSQWQAAQAAIRAAAR
jgi:hypothetical protein